MPSMSDVELIQNFNAAWQDGDLETVLSCVADDIVYTTSGGGGGPVTTYRGRAEVAAIFAEHIGHDPRLTLGPVAAGHGRALCDWWYPVAEDGTSLRGVDVYLIRDGLIRRKDVYAKNGR